MPETVASRWLSLILCAGLAPAALAADAAVSGHVEDVSGARLPGARVEAVETGQRVDSDAEGRFILALPAGRHTLRASFPGFAPAERAGVAAGAQGVVLSLAPAGVAEETVVRALRAADSAPITRTELDAAEFAAIGFGQDLPLALQQAVPGLTAYSEAGVGGSGYSYLSVRGVGQSRINFTFDGVPLNDPEESAFFFANVADIMGAIDSAQVQRGVAASTVGAPAFGGAIGFVSTRLADQAGGEAQAAGGSFGVARGALAAHSGDLPGGLRASGRFSYGEADGYRDHSGVVQRSLFWNTARQGARSLLRFSGFSGRERSELSYYAPDEAALLENPRVNVMQPEEKDDFGQDLAQLQYTTGFGQGGSLNAQAYYSGAQGALTLWSDPAAKDTLLDIGIDGHALAATLTVNHETPGLALHGGLHGSDFRREHFANEHGGAPLYTNTGFKREGNAFAKATLVRGRGQAYGDVQLRHARFSYEGTQAIAPVSWTFFNWRVGGRHEPRPGLTVYASAARATREPTRNDLFAGEDDPSIAYDTRAVRPERVWDLEAGVAWSSPRLSVSANVYAMEFRDEIAQTGELSQVGFPIRTNVDRSFRRGLEVDATFRPARVLRLRSLAALSWNRIGSWTQVLDVYDAAGDWVDSTPRVFADTEPLLTPAVVVDQSIEWLPKEGAQVRLRGRWVSRAFLDNTASAVTEVPSHFTMDFSARYPLAGGRVRLALDVTNLLNDDRIWPSGYSYPYLARDGGGGETLTGVRYFYPLATRAVVAGATLVF